jgi:hypothetical protein
MVLNSDIQIRANVSLISGPWMGRKHARSDGSRRKKSREKMSTALESSFGILVAAVGPVHLGAL